MMGACANLEFRYASEVAQNDKSRADLVSLLVAAAQPYAQALYGEGPASAAIFAALMSRSFSELSADRVQVLLEATELCGCYVALPGAELPTCRRMELLESLRYFGSGRRRLSCRAAHLARLALPTGRRRCLLSRQTRHSSGHERPRTGEIAARSLSGAWSAARTPPLPPRPLQRQWCCAGGSMKRRDFAWWSSAAARLSG